MIQPLLPWPHTKDEDAIVTKAIKLLGEAYAEIGRWKWISAFLFVLWVITGAILAGQL